MFFILLFVVMMIWWWDDVDVIPEVLITNGYFASNTMYKKMKPHISLQFKVTLRKKRKKCCAVKNSLAPFSGFAFASFSFLLVAFDCVFGEKRIHVI